MKLILSYLKHYKKMFALNVLSEKDTAFIFEMGGVILLISLLGTAGTILLGYCCAYLSTSITRDIRNDMFEKTQEFSHREFKEFGTASLITRTTNDAFQIQMFLNILFRTALMTPVMTVGSIVLVLKASLSLSMVILGTVPFIVVGVIIVAKRSELLSERQQSSLEWINRISKENISGIRVIRAFTNDRHEKKRFDEANSAYMGYSKKLFKLMSVTQPAFYFLMNLAGMLIYWISSIMIEQGGLNIGQLVAFMDYLFHVMFSIMLFCLVFMMYPKAAVSARRITKIFDAVPAVENASGEGGSPIRIDEITFDHVTFAYPDGEEAVLTDVSFTVKKGETIAFIGSTGSGKSTLINLVPRAYDVSGGRILVNGKDIREIDLKSLRNSIGFIPQKAMLFSGSIADNLKFGKEDASLKEMEEAAKTAQAYDFIMEKGGFDVQITENATNVSGGQRQRLSIARALVRKPEVYIFDDSFSALDFKTDAKLRKELKKVLKDAVMMVVAQRITSIMDADKIMVLNEGRVVGAGTHKELLESCRIYQEIAASQLDKEELAHD